MQISAVHPAISSSGDSYDVAQIYEAVELDSGSKVIDSYGTVKEAKTVLVPTKLKEGKYSVELTKVDSNFYKIYGTDLYSLNIIDFLAFILVNIQKTSTIQQGCYLLITVTRDDKRKKDLYSKTT